MSKQFYTWGRSSRIVDGDLDWQEFAACDGSDMGLFFGPDGERVEEREAREAKAKEICDGCPVRTDCLTHSLTAPEKSGVWGGLNEDERHTERKRRMRRDSAARVKARKAAPEPKPDPKPRPEPTRVLVSALGSTRRVRAASRVGRRLKLFAEIAGVSESALSKLRFGRVEQVTVSTARKIADAYPLVLAREEVDAVPMAAALVHGWPGPDAWVGVDMDDPDAVPHQATNAA